MTPQRKASLVNNIIDSIKKQPIYWQDSSKLEASLYFLHKYNSLTSCVSYSSLSNEEFLKLVKKFDMKLLQEHVSYNKKVNPRDILVTSSHPCHTTDMDDESDCRYSCTWESQWSNSPPILIYYSGSTNQKNCSINVYYRPDDNTLLKPILDEFNNIIEQVSNVSFYILTKTPYGELDINPFNVTVPDKFDLSKCYGEAFIEHHKKIESKLNSGSAGLYLFHGPPGTGKSTYIKHLPSIIGKKFIYIPEFMVPMLSNPDVISLLMRYPSSVLVIEDAEKLIVKREEGQNDAVSTVLNLSDGILADIMKISIILTHNTSVDNIDDALIRKGRLKYTHKFDNLCKNDTIKLLEHLGYSNDLISKMDEENKILDSMPLADIVNLEETNNISNKKPVEENTRRIGF